MERAKAKKDAGKMKGSLGTIYLLTEIAA